MRPPEGDLPLTLRPMTAMDIDQVMGIERESFREPWTKENFEDEISAEDESELTVAALGEKVAGYTVVWYLGNGVAHLANMAVREECRERGIGRVLVEYVIARAKKETAAQIILEVRESNIEARKLYETLGFRAVGLRKNYYKTEKEDAILMRCLLGGYPGDQDGERGDGG